MLSSQNRPTLTHTIIPSRPADVQQQLDSATEQLAAREKELGDIEARAEAAHLAVQAVEAKHAAEQQRLVQVGGCLHPGLLGSCLGCWAELGCWAGFLPSAFACSLRQRADLGAHCLRIRHRSWRRYEGRCSSWRACCSGTKQRRRTSSRRCCWQSQRRMGWQGAADVLVAPSVFHTCWEAGAQEAQGDLHTSACPTPAAAPAIPVDPWRGSGRGCRSSRRRCWRPCSSSRPCWRRPPLPRQAARRRRPPASTWPSCCATRRRRWRHSTRPRSRWARAWGS